MSWHDEPLPQALPRDVRLMNVLSALLVLALLGAVLWKLSQWVMKHPSFAIASIVVEGDTTHHNALTLQANVSGRLQGNFFTMDLAQTRTVFESVPWVRKAVVRREFPNKLRVKLEEHQAAALWGADTDSRLVNTFGEVFEANVGDLSSQANGSASELPRWVGSDGQSVSLMGMQNRLADIFKPTGADIGQLELSAGNSWRMTLDGGAVIELGRGSMPDIAERAQRFVDSHRQVLAAYQRSSLERVESIDLRYPTGYAIRMRGVSTSGPETTEKKS